MLKLIIYHKLHLHLGFSHIIVIETPKALSTESGIYPIQLYGTEYLSIGNPKT